MAETDTVRALAAAIPKATTPRQKIKLLTKIGVHADWAITETISQIPAEQRDWKQIARLVRVYDVSAAKQIYDPEPWTGYTPAHPDDAKAPRPTTKPRSDLPSDRARPPGRPQHHPRSKTS